MLNNVHFLQSMIEIHREDLLKEAEISRLMNVGGRQNASYLKRFAQLFHQVSSMPQAVNAVKDDCVDSGEEPCFAC